MKTDNLMSEPLDNLSADATPPKAVRVTPGFFKSLRGIWLFTWKSHSAWGRMTVTIVALLVLPVLVYLTTSSPHGWSRRHTLMGNPFSKVTELSGRLTRSSLPLNPEQHSQLLGIFQEEFARAENELNDGGPGTTSVNSQRQQIVKCYERIQNRTRSVLDDRQFASYRDFENRSVTLTQATVREARWGRTEPFYHWLIDFYFFVILPLNCVRASGGLIRDEVQADTLGFLTTRPLRRAGLLFAKFTAQTAWLEMIILLETLLIFAVGALRHIPGLAALFPLFVSAQLVAVLAWSALGIFLGQATKRYMAAALLYGLVVEVGIGRIPTNINNLSLIRQLKSWLAHDAVLQGIYDWSSRGLPYCLGALLVATAVFLGAAALLFTYREYHHTVEMQK